MVTVHLFEEFELEFESQCTETGRSTYKHVRQKLILGTFQFMTYTEVWQAKTKQNKTKQ